MMILNILLAGLSRGALDRAVSLDTKSAEQEPAPHYHTIAVNCAEAATTAPAPQARKKQRSI